MTTLSNERAGVARLHLSLANRLDDLLADPRAQEGWRTRCCGSAWPACTSGSAACAT